MTFQRVLAITTSRDVCAAVRSYVSELRYMRKRTGEDVLLLIVEDGPISNSVSVSNREAIGALARTCALPIQYVSSSEVRLLVKQVVNDDELRPILTSTEVNYGRAFNLTCLIAAGYGARVIHRRDSDTCLIEAEDHGLTPSRVEIDHLGLPNTRWKTRALPVSLVGGNYYGSYNMDLGVFSGHEDLLREFFDLLYIPEEGKEHILSVQIPQSKVLPSGRSVKQTYGQIPDMGNVAFSSDLFDYFSVPIHPETQGLDYFYVSLLLGLGECVLLHNANVLHQHQEARSAAGYQRVYWRRKAAQLDALHLYRELFRRGERLGYSAFREHMASIMHDITAERETLLPTRRLCWRRLVGIFGQLGGELGPIVAEDLRRLEAEVLQKNEKLFELHARLQHSWPRLVAAVRDLRWTIPAGA